MGVCGPKQVVEGGKRTSRATGIPYTTNKMYCSRIREGLRPPKHAFHGKLPEFFRLGLKIYLQMREFIHKIVGWLFRLVWLVSLIG